MDTELRSPQGTFHLHRLPRRPRELLRAWDAADEYLLAALAERSWPGTRRTLILNDGFGALAVALHATAVQAQSDSWLSQQATRENLVANGQEAAVVPLYGSLDAPEGPIELLVVKVPKTIALLEDQLCRLRPLLADDCQLIAAGMVKGLAPAAWRVIEQYFGATTTSLAWKKARLIEARLDPSLPVVASPYPVRYALEGRGWPVVNHANVFSREALDIGTRFFLQHLPTLPEARDIIDLGCGNGLVGLVAAEQHPLARLHFIDESHMAIASARANFAAVFPGREALFRLGDTLEGVEGGCADLVLCNPPFHQQQGVGDQIANAMFRHAARVLRPGGELWVVGNRHLDYHQTLKRHFRTVASVASNRKFVILRANKPTE